MKKGVENSYLNPGQSWTGAYIVQTGQNDVDSIHYESQVMTDSTVAASYTETQNACWRDCKTFSQIFRDLHNATSMKQEPNISLGV